MVVQQINWSAGRLQVAAQVPSQCRYWVMATTQSEAYPFVEGGFKFVEQALEWGEEYGIGVLIDFHAAPGSQNGAIAHLQGTSCIHDAESGHDVVSCCWSTALPHQH